MAIIKLIQRAWYGDQPVAFPAPDSWEINVCGDKIFPEVSPEIIREKILIPISSEPISRLAVGKSHPAIILDDLSRPTPAAKMLPVILQEIFRAGIPPENTNLFIAGGTHPPDSPEMITRKLGIDIPSSIRVHAHDCRKDLRYFGKSRNGTPIYINEALMACDLKISLGCIYPHPAAGFSGGAKMVIPGMAGFETIRQLHDRFIPALQRGGDVENAFRRECETITAQIGLDFIVNALLNQERQICGIFSGHFIDAFRMGVQTARELYQVPLPGDADLVIADMYPFDTSLQFAADRGFWPLFLAKSNAQKIVIADCPLGVGSHVLFPVTGSFRARLIRRIKTLTPRDFPTFGYRLGVARKMLAQKSMDISLISGGVSKGEWQRIFPNGNHFPDWDTLLENLQQVLPARPKVAVYRCAPLFIPPS